jgi:hypothetical protein
MRLAPALLLLPVLALGCATADDPASAATSNLDTSGCTNGPDPTSAEGPVEVRAAIPPWKSCWNVPTGGVTLGYAWLQRNEPAPQKDNVGFWTSLNGVGVYAKAASYGCRVVPGGGLGHDTSGERLYRCTAQKTFSFGAFPGLLERAYGPDGIRPGWDVEVAVSLDDAGTPESWDSKGGANYRFRF